MMEKTKGLTSLEARKRLAEFGPNELEQEEKAIPLKLLLAQFKSPLIYILFFAGLITLFLQEWTDAVVIFMAVGLNTCLGFFQEYKAERALTALRKILVPHALVIRDGQKEKVEVADLVPGDLVVLGTGDKIPADGKLVEGVEFHANEAILTGESAPVLKKEGDEVYMGSVVASGRGQFLVGKTGLTTKMGKIAARISQTVEESTPLKKQIGKFSRTLAIIFSLICVLIFFEGLWRERPFIEMFKLSVAVAVAAIPEGLVVSLTVIMTLGMQRILKRKGLVRRLLAAETLGAVDVICADKTGTLTEGKMRVVEAPVNQELKGAADKLWRATVLCNNLINPLELSMMDWARAKSALADQLAASHQRIDEIPFSSDRKFISVLAKGEENEAELFFSGAPEVVLQMAKLTVKERQEWLEKLNEFTRRGLRAVAFGYLADKPEKLKKQLSQFRKIKNSREAIAKGDHQLEWLGLVLFEDPVRAEVKDSLKKCRQAGITVKVITGDYRNTAIAVLNKLEVAGGDLKPEQVLEGAQLVKMSDEALKEVVDEVVLFARTTPEQKIRLVQVLQEKGHSVAMMGDGVNDALALKKADIGVVVGEASEVAKETADMVLLDSNFKTIVAAVEEGRGIFENIRKVILYLLSDSFTEVILIGGALFMGWETPLLPAQILWVNLVEDGLPGLALAFEPKDKDLMKDKPRPKHARVLDKELRAIIFVIGIMTDIALLVTFFILRNRNVPMETIRSVIFAGLAIDSLLYVFSCKTLRKNIWEEDLLNNKFLLFSVGVGVALLLAGLYLPLLNTVLKTVPLDLKWWGLILGLGGLSLAGIELIKWLFLRHYLK